jgi:membrane protein implicated in regulation of membrane protease activity
LITRHEGEDLRMGHENRSNPAKRMAVLVAGGAVLVVGVVLLVLPGPGLLLVLAGLIILATEFPAVEKYVDPVQDRAMKAAEESVSSPLRITGSVLAGLALIAAGVVWGLVPALPLGGWATGSSLMLSGVVLLALLVYSYRRVRSRRAGSRSSEPA